VTTGVTTVVAATVSRTTTTTAAPGSRGGHAVEDDSNRGPGAGGHGADDLPGDDRDGRSGSDG
jgi:hypothetical protein